MFYNTRMILSRGSVHAFPGNKKAFKDATRLFGGDYTSGIFFEGRQYTSPDGIVRASHDRGKEAIAWVTRTNDLEGSARWAALTAYASRAGAPLTELSVEVPGLVAATEWKGRQSQRIAEINARQRQVEDERDIEVEKLIVSIPSESEYRRQVRKTHASYDQRAADVDNELNAVMNTRTLVVPSYASGGSGIDKFFDRILSETQDALDLQPNLTLLGNMARTQAIFDGMQAADQTVPDDDPNTVSKFLILDGNGLPELAHRLADTYGDMVFHADSQPDITVANTVGAPDLDTLDRTWEQAMNLPTPLAAGQFVLAQFLSY